MTEPAIDNLPAQAQLSEVLRRYWGYDGFLPLQQPAMESVLAGRDSVVVLPTGGGKSLCFQAPALCMPGMAVVVSPLISLMKDQVDALVACGVPAACINSSMSFEAKRQVADDIRSGSLRLLYIAPERLVTERTLSFLKSVDVSFIAIDEAHCISAWGHDFRPEYRGLRMLRDVFPNIGVHAYTATASATVRDDIARELSLQDPELLIGSFDRPNLLYRVESINSRLNQIVSVIERHKDESGIVYCISRNEVDKTAATLKELGYRTRPYHAGLSDDDRQRNQEAFIQEKVDIIVATVAFGMGIDKSNVRYVVHAGMPKSLESYQQESGRAGRDGLEAECCLFYSGRDFHVWKNMLDQTDPQAFEASVQSLTAMYDYCTSLTCRHRTLVGYFGEELPHDCGKSCDVCLGDVDLVDDALVIGQKVLSCIVRLEQRFGGDYTAKVLTGSKDQRIVQSGHDGLSTWGLLADQSHRTVRDWIEQLVAQGFAAHTGEYNVLSVTAEGRRLLRGEVAPRLSKPKQKSSSSGSSSRSATQSADAWEGVDRELFDQLKQLRKEKAEERELPSYMIFSDAALRDMARLRPSSTDELLAVKGVGEKKLRDFGDDFLACISTYCGEHGMPTNVSGSAPAAVQETPRETKSVNMAATAAFEHFRAGRSVEEVAEQMGRAVSTVQGYLVEYLRHNDVRDPSMWVDAATIELIKQAAHEVGIERLKPVYEALGGEISYDPIRIVLTCLNNEAAEIERES